MYTYKLYMQQGLEEGSGGDSLFPHPGFQNTTQATQQKMNMYTLPLLNSTVCTHTPHTPHKNTLRVHWIVLQMIIPWRTIPLAFSIVWINV